MMMQFKLLLIYFYWYFRLLSMQIYSHQRVSYIDLILLTQRACLPACLPAYFPAYQ